MPEINRFKIIKTEDGSDTIFDSEYNEAMHTLSGAYEESLHKHIYPSKILSAAKKEVNILDVGLGLGYNILALLNEFSKSAGDIFVRIYSLEKTRLYYDKMNELKFNDHRDMIYNTIKKAFCSGSYSSDRYSISVIMGDARNTVKKLPSLLFDAVFHDPYSPSKNPELWTVQFFKEIYSSMDKEGILTTYSSAPQVRGALIEAGFIIGKGPSFGRKREGTTASKTDMIEPLDKDEINELMQNIKSTPYLDLSLADERGSILQRRIDEMKEKRIRGCRQVRQV